MVYVMAKNPDYPYARVLTQSFIRQVNTLSGEKFPTHGVGDEPQLIAEALLLPLIDPEQSKSTDPERTAAIARVALELFGEPARKTAIVAHCIQSRYTEFLPYLLPKIFKKSQTKSVLNHKTVITDAAICAAETLRRTLYTDTSR